MAMWAEDLVSALESADKHLSIVTRRLIVSEKRPLKTVRHLTMSAIHLVRGALELLHEEKGVK